MNACTSEQPSSSTKASNANSPSVGSDRKRRVLVGCTGSIAAVKLPLLVQELLDTKKFEVCVVVTENALKFIDVSAVPAEAKVYRDKDEWEVWSKIPDPVLHIELRRWADLMVIAPLDANTLAKMASGLCDNLLMLVVRAWDLERPLLFCPAMNTYMWNHPITSQQVTQLSAWGYTEVPCVEKLLACGDKGFGAMAEVQTIVDKVKEALTPIK